MNLQIEDALKMGIEAHKTGQIEQASVFYKKVLQLQPEHPNANHNLGVVACETGKTVDALPLFRAALEGDASVGYYWLSYIQALIKLGMIEDAQIVFHQAKKIGAEGEGFDRCEMIINEINSSANPNTEGAIEPAANILNHLNVDQALRLAKKNAADGLLNEAKKICDDILVRFPQNRKAKDLLRTLVSKNIEKPAQRLEPPKNLLDKVFHLSSHGKGQEALEEADELLKRFPRSASVYNIQGIVNSMLGKFETAIDCFNNAITSAPDYSDAHYNLGKALMYYGDVDAAINSYQDAISFRSEFADAHCSLGTALYEKGDFLIAIAAMRRALEINPDNAEAYNSLGAMLHYTGDTEGAIESTSTAIKLKPDYAEGYCHLAHYLRDKGDIEKSIKSADTAIKLKPNYAEAYFNNALSYLLKGDLETGLELYEWRMSTQRKEFTKPPRAPFVWDGKSDLTGKRFVVYTEQGLGDVILFSRYLSLLAEKGARVDFISVPKLHTLLGSLDGNINLLSQISKHEIIDFETPLLSLPYLFKTNLDSIPTKNFYLKADAAQVKYWNEKLNPDTFKVGICWQGSNSGRALSLALFEGIASIPGLELISLHKGSGENQINAKKFPLTTFGAELDAGKDAFFDTSAIMMNCDLIITIDTSVAHLAGALGRKTWIALSQTPDWRWMLDRKDSPWYPNVTLYRQKKKNDWYNIFEDIERDLRDLVEQKGNIK